jgi:hypothetical protein
MITLAFAIFGALLGALIARRNGGVRLDLVQYSAGFAIALALVGLFVTIFIFRLAA